MNFFMLYPFLGILQQDFSHANLTHLFLIIRILLQTCAGVVFDILMQNPASKSESNGNYKKYRGTDRYEKY